MSLLNREKGKRDGSVVVAVRRGREALLSQMRDPSPIGKVTDEKPITRLDP